MERINCVGEKYSKCMATTMKPVINTQALPSNVLTYSLLVNRALVLYS